MVVKCSDGEIMINIVDNEGAKMANDCGMMRCYMIRGHRVWSTIGGTA